MDAVAVQAGVEGPQVGEALGAQALLVLLEEAHLDLGGHDGAKAGVQAALDDALEDEAGGDGQRVADLSVEVADDGGAVLLPGDDSQGRQVGPGDDVGEADLPVGVGEGADDFVLDVPAEEDVALGKAVLGGGQEVVGTDPLAPVDAVQVGAADADGPYVMVTQQLSGSFDVHGATSARGRLGLSGRIVPSGERKRTGQRSRE